jgi:hypothetical protein
MISRARRGLGLMLTVAGSGLEGGVVIALKGLVSRRRESE